MLNVRKLIRIRQFYQRIMSVLRQDGYFQFIIHILLLLLFYFIFIFISYMLIPYLLLIYTTLPHDTYSHMHTYSYTASIQYNIIPKLAFFEHSLTLAIVSTLNCDCIFQRCLPTLLFFDLGCIPIIIQSASNSLVHYSNSISTIYSPHQNLTKQQCQHLTITQFFPNFISIYL